MTSAGGIGREVFSDHARLVERSFLYRVVEVTGPFQARLTYSGWWFRQVLLIDQTPCWFQISWLKIHPRIEIDLPVSVPVAPGWAGPECVASRRLALQLDFSRGLRIRRFRIWLAGRILYDEIT